MTFIAATHGGKKQLSRAERCALLFAETIANPLDTDRKAPCLPVKARPSIKWFERQFLEFQAGSLGVGFVAFKRDYANDRNAIFHSESSYAGSTITANTATAGVAGVPHKFPIDNALWSGGHYEHRVVCEAIRVKPVDAALNVSGSIYSLVEPNHNNLDGLGSAQLATYPKVQIQQPDTRKQASTIVYAPLDSVDYEWTSTGIVGNSLLIGAHVVQAEPGARFHVEIVTWHEMQTRLMPGISPSEAAPAITEQILANQKNANPTSHSKHINNAITTGRKSVGFIKELLQGVNNAGRFISAVAPKVVKTLAPVVKEALQIGGAVAPLAIAAV